MRNRESEFEMKRSLIQNQSMAFLAMAFTIVGILAFTIGDSGSARVRHYFNDPLVFSAPSSKTNSEIGLALLALIDEAQYSIDFAAYGFRDQEEVIAAMIRAEKRGVRVRGVVDANVDGENYYMDIEEFRSKIHNVRTDEASDLRQVGQDGGRDYHPYWKRPAGFNGPASCVGYTIGHGRALIGVQASRQPIASEGEIMHNKFFVVDGRYVWTGSCNLSDSGTGGYNANAASVIDDTELAKWYTSEFEQMFISGRFHGEKTSQPSFDRWIAGERVQAFTSPKAKTIHKHLLPLIRSARSEIDIAVFFLTSKAITAELIRAKERGVMIRVILDATGTKNEYTKFEFLRAAGIPVKIENWGGKMHCKAAQIDRSIFITGSMNWTSAGEYQNDENTLIFHSGSAASDFHSHFNVWWNSIGSEWLSARPDPESSDSGTSCHDGVDNDFDGLADAEDPGCSRYPPPLPALCPLRWVDLGPSNELIKGNINSSGKRYYFIPTNPYYDKTIIDEAKGERWFGSPEDAESFGWQRPYGR